MRTVLPINDNWNFSEQWLEQYASAAMPTNVVSVPHTTREIPLNSFDEHCYQMHCGYQRTLAVTAEMLAGKLYVHFEAVAHSAVVYCNGTEVARHMGGYTAFDADISACAVVGNNLLSVEVDCIENSDIPPFSGLIDYLCFGGIYREVQLVAVATQHITSLHIDGSHQGMANVSIQLADSASTVADITICDMAGNEVHTKQCTIEGATKLMMHVPNITPWSIAAPRLYNITVTIDGDSVTERFGFRTVQFTGKGFFLNGKRVKILGLNRHQSYPYVGYAMPRALQELDADKVKASGCNLVRQSHYPQSKHFNNRCDEIGLLVFCEAPGWQSIGGDSFRANYLSAVGEMINEHYNHPSIIIWGVRVNESQDCDELYTESNRLAHSIDSSRPTTGVRDFKKSHLLEDVYSFNDFTHSGGDKATAPKKKVCGDAPLLITEHNGHMFPTKPTDHVDKRIEHTLRHARVINSAFGSTDTSGVIGWCFSDYNTHIQFGSGDRICYHGVTDMFRNAKTAHALYASQGTAPTLDILSTADLGDYATMVRTKIVVASNCDYITVYNNDREVHTFYPDYKSYPHLPHPPFVIDHLLYGEVSRLYGYSEQDEKRILKALMAGIQGMQNVAMRAILPIQIKYRKPMEYWRKVAMRIVNRAGENDNFVFAGFIDGKKVIEKPFGSSGKAQMTVSTPTPAVQLYNTYEIAQIDVTMADDRGNISLYCDDVVTIEATGADVVYSNSGALIGGRRSFYIRSSKAGKVTATVSNTRGEQCHIELEFVK